MTTPCKVSISASVVVGVKEIIATGKMHNETVSVQVVIKMAMDKAADHITSLTLCTVQVC